jgi:hypothetical protein
MTQVVEPEADLLAFLEHARLHRSRMEMIFGQHVGDAGLLTFECTGAPTVSKLLEVWNHESVSR